MITAEQLAAKNYPQECWINVYYLNKIDGYVYGANMYSRHAAIYAGLRASVRPCYRIHVRLK